MVYIVDLREISKIFNQGGIPIVALNDVSLQIDKGEFVAIMGPSGSGKSTMLQILGLLDRPSSGDYLIEEKPTAGLKDRQLARLRGEKIGFIFQTFNLLGRLSLQQNVELPMVYAGLGSVARKERAKKLLGAVGLKDRAGFKPNQVSGGETQRAAIARALANKPSLILADEPTGNLDSKNGQQVMDLLTGLNRKGTTVVLVTHDSHVAGFAKRIVRMRDGEIVG